MRTAGATIFDSMRSVSASTSEKRSSTCAAGAERGARRKRRVRVEARRLDDKSRAFPPPDRGSAPRLVERARGRLVAHVDATHETGFDRHRDAPGRKEDLERAAASRGRTTRESLLFTIGARVERRRAVPLQRFAATSEDVRLRSLRDGDRAKRVRRRSRRRRAPGRRRRRRQHERYRRRRPGTCEIGEVLRGIRKSCRSVLEPELRPRRRIRRQPLESGVRENGARTYGRPSEFGHCRTRSSGNFTFSQCPPTVPSRSGQYSTATLSPALSTSLVQPYPCRTDGEPSLESPVGHTSQPCPVLGT